MMWITLIKAAAEECETFVIDLPPGLEYALAAVTAVSDLVTGDHIAAPDFAPRPDLFTPPA